MKKLAFDSSNWKLIGTINDLIDLVNSQQEAIERLEKVITRDTVRIVTDDIIDALSEPADTHRTVTLRIPKGMRIGEAIQQTKWDMNNEYWLPWLINTSDTDLQKALDEVKE